MFDYIAGKLVSKLPKYFVVDVGGIGFNIFITLSTYSSSPQEGEFIKLFVYMHIREDAVLLYGFKTQEEKQAFEMLLSVSGVGPKVAVNILSEVSVEELKSVIISQDAGAITSIPGIGKKIAQRILLELKEKIMPLSEKSESGFAKNQNLEDAVSALISLGYTQPASYKSIRSVLEKEKKELPIQILIKKALKELK